jgi:hypothetical protein
MVVEAIFYLLDVSTRNALVLYNEQLKVHSKGQEYTRLNVAEFKMKLVEDLVSKLLTGLFGDSCPDKEMEHTCVPIPGGQRVKCAYCGLMSQETRTRYMCAVYGVPLCSMGSGKVKYDCFTKAHKTEDRVDMVLKKHQQMQMKNLNQNSK